MDGKAFSSEGRERGRGGLPTRCESDAWGAPIARRRPRRVLTRPAAPDLPDVSCTGNANAWRRPREEVSKDGEEAGASSGRGRNRAAQHARGARRRHGRPSRTARSECDGLPPGRAGTGQGQRHRRGPQGASNAGRRAARSEGSCETAQCSATSGNPPIASIHSLFATFRVFQTNLRATPLPLSPVPVGTARPFFGSSCRSERVSRWRSAAQRNRRSLPFFLLDNLRASDPNRALRSFPSHPSTSVLPMAPRVPFF